MNVVFFPRNDYPSKVEVCVHRFGKKMTYTEQTDTLAFNSSYSPFMTLAKARGIKVGSFVRYSELSSQNFQVALADEANNHIWLDQYDECPYLQEKLDARVPITQEEFNYAYNNELGPAFVQAVGRKPVAMSYRNGVTANFTDAVISHYLAGRNSVPSGSFDTNTFPMDYGVGYGNPNDEPYSASRYKSKASTMRWFDAAIDNDNDFAGELNVVGQKIDEALLNGGWVNNFTHWHQYDFSTKYDFGGVQKTVPEAYLDLLATKNANNEIYFAGYGEAVAYLVYRQLVTKVVMYSPVKYPSTQLVIRLETQNNLSVDTDLLQVPISVKLSTTGTPLAGMTIKSNRNLLSLGNGEYIVEIPFDRFPYAIIEKV